MGGFMSLGTSVKGDFDNSISSSHFFSCPVSLGEHLCATTCFKHDLLYYHRPKSNRANSLWTEISKNVTQNKPLTFMSGLSQGFYFSSQKLTDIVSEHQQLPKSRVKVNEWKIIKRKYQRRRGILAKLT
jgi:hypothetical protein